MSMKPLPVPAAWDEHVTAWASTLRAGGAPATTIHQRTYWVTRLARDVELDPWDVTADVLLAWAGAHSWARDTRRSAYAGVRQFYGWAVTRGLTDVDPSTVLPSVRQSLPAPHPCPDHVLARALLAADAEETLMLRLAAEAGLRRGEVARVHARDLTPDLAGTSLVVHGKGGKDRTVPLSDDLAREITDRARGGWAFPARFGDGHMTEGAVGHKVGRLLGDGWGMHSLRHRFATRAYVGSSDLLAVQQLLGHASPTTTQRYVLVDAGRLRAAMAAAA